MTLTSFARLVLLAGIPAGLYSGPALAEHPASPLQAVTTQVIGPAHQQWFESNRRLNDSLQAFCQGKQDLAAARNHWREAMLSWSHLQPMLLDSANSIGIRVNYWPDKKNLVAHQVESLLSQSSPLPTAEELEQRSVATQGLSAIEYLLFDPKKDLADQQRKSKACPLLQAIGGRQLSLAQTIQLGFEADGGLAKQLTATPNARFADNQEATAEVVKSLVSSLELSKKKLAAALGSSTPQPYQAEYWRSGTGLQALQATLDGVSQVWQSGVRARVQEKNPELAESVDILHRTLTSQLQSAGALAELLGTPAGVRKVKAIAGQLRLLHQVYANDVSQALGIQLGFNAHDGD